ncbi:CBS domain-containing protein [Stieleria varia]|uniref:Inosine 5'-monophosphate dehydrogenase n=1 Tax=Stieleria varia TaxID=2528005 RepID=A0A5C5ZW63_9BACT|nr:CBS domain-containing protein [Stieleria varia]TWT91278.1 inosine 5'-monophosphate dehydrogenase [Stieleria varia]
MIDEKKLGSSVSDLMSCDVVTIRSDATIGELLELMQREQVSSVPVVDDGLCVGMVTSTDLARLIRDTNEVLHSDYPHYEDCVWAVDLARRKFKEDPVVEIMQGGIVSVAPTDDISQAAKKMMTQRVHHLAVMDNGRLIGFLSSCDFVRALG